MKSVVDRLVDAFAVFLAVFALGYMLVPVQTLNLLGFTTDASGLLFLRFVGSLSMGFAVFIWMTRGAASAVRKPVVLALFVMFLTSFVIVLHHQITQGFGNLGWFGVIMYGLSAIFLGWRFTLFSQE